MSDFAGLRRNQICTDLEIKIMILIQLPELVYYPLKPCPQLLLIGIFQQHGKV